MHRTTSIAVALALFVGVACADDDTAPAPGPPAEEGSTDPAQDEGVDADETDLGPTARVAAEGWVEVAPTDVGLDPAVLDELAAEAEAGGSHCLLVVRDGRIAGEWTWSDHGVTEAQEVWSVTKSVTSVMAGIALDDAVLELDDTVARWVPEWAGTPSEAVTVRNLLANDSGRFQSFETDYQEMIQAADRTAYAIEELDQAAEPGTEWVYNNAAIQVLEQVLSEATGTDLPDLVAERLLEPLGMDDSWLSTDPAGNGLAFMGLQSTCRDLARFGLMVLDRGRWGDEHVVPQEYLEVSTSPSQDLNVSYGLLWWLNAAGGRAEADSPGEAVTDAGEDDRMVPGAPPDLVWALGLGGQIVQVHPGTGTVVVRLGPPTLGDDGLSVRQTSRVVTEAVLDVLDDIDDIDVDDD